MARADDEAVDGVFEGDAGDGIAEGDRPFLPPEGTVTRRLYRRMAAGDREAAGLVWHYFAAVAGMPVPATKLLLGGRLASGLGVDREALVREVAGITAGRSGPGRSAALRHGNGMPRTRAGRGAP